MEVLDPDQMDKASAVVAAHIYAIASLPGPLTRGKPLSPKPLTLAQADVCANLPTVVSCKPLP